MNPELFKIVKWSVNHLLENNEGVTVSDLEAEVINLASFLYLKQAAEIDFTLDYLDDDLLDEVESFDVGVIEEVAAAATMLFPKYYTSANAALVRQSVLMNLQVMGLDDYAGFLKGYFSSKHKIALDGEGDEDSNIKTERFQSPFNSLWQKEDGKEVLVTGSDTNREVICRFDFDTSDFDVLINPYNPNVKGKITFRSPYLVRGTSHDRTRSFEFHYKDLELNEVIMHRLDKDDLVKYHKVKVQL